ncbi:midcut-by-XrtH protein [Cocleimonas sp. KMM 6892]|uniref:midcut-by-XrtH protein n=1 Tax=unclassified Cocleimonas TaxID=2639732 RepID=UPI002DBCA17F|nr:MULTISPECIES: midcut-by-XrtH protein [unclassified Cocleimonas]MEB8432810.1 midcut-by-XrtH protein [Cocleimonas sp. KMM 6892]MEC4715669.1 midcut-by-XrtH protein [Cocleimonas sp. KMM 6895]MEC4744713.1 midcut-by-XrtH protein [Cocleimonas sp. KMM 6896]
MNLLKSIVTKTSFSLLLCLTSISTAMAGSNGSLIYGPLNPTAVPTLSGTMLIILSLLLFVVALKVAKQKGSNAGKFFITLIGASALVTGIGGVKLVSEVDAGLVFNPPLVEPAGTTVTIFEGRFNQFVNSTGVAQQIKEINLVDNEIEIRCGNYPNGVSVQNECSVGLTLSPNAICNIDCDDAPIEGVMCDLNSDCAEGDFCDEGFCRTPKIY